MISDLGGVLDAVWSYAADASMRIDAIGNWADKVETPIVDEELPIKIQNGLWLQV